MRMRVEAVVAYTALLCVCSPTVLGVAPRRARTRSRRLESSLAGSQLEAYLADLSRRALQRPAPVPRTPAFRASVTRCCKLGDKTARKQLSCALDQHAQTRKTNLVHKTKLGLRSSVHAPSDILLQRISKCASSKYAANMHKCCTYRAAFLREMEACRALHAHARKTCRRDARKRYP